jgi:hypothetical protein
LIIPSQVAYQKSGENTAATFVTGVLDEAFNVPPLLRVREAGCSIKVPLRNVFKRHAWRVITKFFIRVRVRVRVS